MARVCAVTGKKTTTGNNRPWSKKATKRTFRANLQTRVINGKKVKVSTKGLKTLRKQAKA